ncbi:MAG: ubiquinone/menaquinone biosynthesis methyltransferase [Deltaproteobacteria bacterium]|nr:ubiquinone/menaquinone biosynthesis methyltransferase [Deltaproteobacteria bacterium]
MKIEKRPEDVRAMFDGISKNYDLMNLLMTLGQDRSWRRCVAEMAAPPKGGSVLDAGAGTGGISIELLRRWPEAAITGADFSPEMLAIARKRPGAGRISWVLADATALPFADESFDAVTSGYLVRNVPDPLAAFSEQARVLKRGGRVVCLETSPPPDSPLLPFIRVHLKYVIPFLGSLVSGNRSAYTYLPETTQNFLSTEALSKVMGQAGLRVVNVRRFMFGTQSVITAVKS